MSGVVEVELVVHSVGAPGCSPAVLVYDAADPFAVALRFPGHYDPRTWDVVTWTFARQLLARGMTAATGDGDVTVGPDDDQEWLLLGLTGFDYDGTPAHAGYRLPRHRVAYFLRRSYGLVRLGAERVDVEPWIADCLTGGA